MAKLIQRSSIDPDRTARDFAAAHPERLGAMTTAWETWTATS